MKKGLVALAVLGAFSGAALAQSSVTMYGILDVNYMWEEKPTTVGSGTSARVQQESTSAINGGHQSGSRLGFRGTEDLGGGLKAIFDAEMGFDNTTGNLPSGGRLFHRQVYAGLASDKWGAVVAGRLAAFSSGTGDFDMWGRVDPFSTGFALAGLGSTFISSAALRADNTIAYQTPTWGGFKGGIGYSLNYNGAEVTPSGGNTKVLMLGGNFTSGPFFVSVTYDAVDYADATPSRPDQKHLQIGGTFDIGAFRLHAAFADQSNISTILAPSGVSSVIGITSGGAVVLPANFSYDNTAWMLGATWTMGAFKVFGSYQVSDADGQTISGKNVEPDYSVWGIGGSYNLSRRTNLYASYASRDADGTLLGNQFNYKQLAIGMRHLF